MPILPAAATGMAFLTVFGFIQMGLGQASPLSRRLKRHC